MPHFVLFALMIVVGLGVCFLSSYGGKLKDVFWWAGIIVALLGLLLLILPVLIYIAHQIESALGG